jgi:hypothetical protein
MPSVPFGGDSRPATLDMRFALLSGADIVQDRK